MVASSSMGCLQHAPSSSFGGEGGGFGGGFGGGSARGDGDALSPGGGDVPRRLSPSSHSVPAGYDAFLEGSKRQSSRPGSALGGCSALGGPLGGSVVSGGSPQDSARLSASSGPPGSARDDAAAAPRFSKASTMP